MTKHISSESVVQALLTLKELQVKRTGRTSAMGWLLLKAKEPASETEFEIASTGEDSVAQELSHFFRVAPGTLLPDVNPFGQHDGRIEYLAPDYERRGTYTHLYEGRNLASIVEAKNSDEGFQVLVPASAAGKVADRLGRKLPLGSCAAFLMRNEPFDNDADTQTVIAAFLSRFHITDSERTDLFEDEDNFEVEFSPEQFINGLSSFPIALQPPSPSATHSTTARASSELLQLIDENEFELVIDEAVLRRARQALRNSRAVALSGPPGTAKSGLMSQLLEEAAVDPASLGMKNAPKFLRVTAEVDWTARTIIGGHYPDENGRLVFREGYLLQAIKNDQILWIDELNRADLDRVLGPVFTFLAGQSVDLGATEHGPEAKQMVLAWSDTPDSGSKEDDAQRLYYAGKDWRLVATYNNVDRGRVFPMGSALTRRWAIVPVPPVGIEIARDVIGVACRDVVSDLLARAYDAHLRHLAIGLAPFIEIARFTNAVSESGQTGSLTDEERQAIVDGYILYMGQQLSRLDPEARDAFFEELAGILGQDLIDEILDL